MSSEPSSDFDRLYADYSGLPEHARAEIVDGVVRLLPRPSLQHSRMASLLATRLGTYLDRGRREEHWVTVFEPELRLGDQIRIPDLAAWRVERYEEDLETNYTTVAPDWICEVLSPSTARTDRTEKMPLYARHGVEHLWIVDPRTETLEVYRRQESLWLLLATLGADDPLIAEPFGDVGLRLGETWRVPGR